MLNRRGFLAGLFATPVVARMDLTLPTVLTPTSVSYDEHLIRSHLWNKLMKEALLDALEASGFMKEIGDDNT